jgi:Protein of unknown function (DUF2891)
MSDEWSATLRTCASGYARVALTNIAREFPSDIRHVMRGPDDVPARPRERTPVFFGSFDWHSCVEMHWVLVRLLRIASDAVPAEEIRAALDAQFTAPGLAAEAKFMADPDHGPRQRPYGWGWALQLARELAVWDDPDARRWVGYFAPLAAVITDNFLEWFPKATYPVRYGLHPNSAFGLARALPYARANDAALLAGITRIALRWFAGDTDYPAAWEPSGSDFLSPALTEAELMAQLLPVGEFPAWLSRFLPGIVDGSPAALFTPVTVSDSTDGQIAHLHGLNASRAWCWRRIAEELPPGDSRVRVALDAAHRHASAALPHVTGNDYMVEHWLAAYAVLLMS